METVKVVHYFSESSLRGYCHVEYKIIRKAKDRVLRSLDELKKKEWFNPVKVILTGLTAAVIIAIVIDAVSRLLSNV